MTVIPVVEKSERIGIVAPASAGWQAWTRTAGVVGTFETVDEAVSAVRVRAGTLTLAPSAGSP